MIDSVAQQRQQHGNGEAGGDVPAAQRNRKNRAAADHTEDRNNAMQCLHPRRNAERTLSLACGCVSGGLEARKITLDRWCDAGRPGLQPVTAGKLRKLLQGVLQERAQFGAGLGAYCGRDDAVGFG